MISKIDALRDRLDSGRMKGAKSMWYMLFANAVADRLCETDTITRADMRQIFERRMAEARAGAEAAILVPGYEECIARLDAYKPEAAPGDGYEPTGQ